MRPPASRAPIPHLATVAAATVTLAMAAAALILAGCGGAATTVTAKISIPRTRQGVEALAERVVAKNCHVRVISATCRPGGQWTCVVESESGARIRFDLPGGFFCH